MKYDGSSNLSYSFTTFKPVNTHTNNDKMGNEITDERTEVDNSVDKYWTYTKLQ